jgi:hypothetical protein
LSVSIIDSGIIMKLRHTVIASVFTLVSLAAYAADSSISPPVSRESVKASVVAARASHQLRPAGDAADYSRNEVSTPSTGPTRAQVKEQVREARANGDLQPAGEGAEYTVAQGPSTWDRTRAEVKAETIEARNAGELIPAGEGVHLAAETTTPNRHPIQKLAARWHKLRTAAE